MYDELGLPNKIDIVSVDENENIYDSDICSIELEPEVQDIDDQFGIHLKTFEDALNPELFRMMKEKGHWNLRCPIYKDNGCLHIFINSPIKDKYEICSMYPLDNYKYNCEKCDFFIYCFCAKERYSIEFKDVGNKNDNTIEKLQIPLEEYQCINLTTQDMIFIFRQLKEKIDNNQSLVEKINELRLELDRVKQELFDFKKAREINRKGKGIVIESPEETYNRSVESIEFKELNLRDCNSTPLVRINNLINFMVEIEFEDGYKIKLRAMLDIGATRNYIKSSIIPKRYRLSTAKDGVATTACGHLLKMNEYLKRV